MDERISILMCGNAGVRDGLVLCALSIAATTRREVCLYIGTMDLSDLDPAYIPIDEGTRELVERILTEGNKNSRAILFDMGATFRRELTGGANMQTRYTPYAMLRLCADEYPLPERLLYLDTDVMALGDIGALYDVDISEYEYAAVKDRYGRWFISPRYINSGVMLWNLEKMRESGLLPRARKMCRERKMLLCDQTALNRCARAKRILPRAFNEQGDRRGDTVIQHFSMRIKWIPFRTENVKPWQPERLRERLGVCYLDGYISRWESMRAAGYKYIPKPE